VLRIVRGFAEEDRFDPVNIVRAVATPWRPEAMPSIFIIYHGK